VHIVGFINSSKTKHVLNWIQHKMVNLNRGVTGFKIFSNQIWTICRKLWDAV